jgi:hypothetical protein
LRSADASSRAGASGVGLVAFRTPAHAKRRPPRFTEGHCGTDKEAPRRDGPAVPE